MEAMIWLCSSKDQGKKSPVVISTTVKYPSGYFSKQLTLSLFSKYKKKVLFLIYLCNPDRVRNFTTHLTLVCILVHFNKCGAKIMCCISSLIFMHPMALLNHNYKIMFKGAWKSNLKLNLKGFFVFYLSLSLQS